MKTDYEILDKMDRDYAIACFEQGKCPICGAGNFKRVLSHIYGLHGITAYEIKDILLISHRKGFCDDDLNNRISQNNLRLNSSRYVIGSKSFTGGRHSETSIAKMSKSIKEKYEVISAGNKKALERKYGSEHGRPIEFYLNAAINVIRYGNSFAYSRAVNLTQGCVQGHIQKAKKLGLIIRTGTTLNPNYQLTDKALQLLHN